MASIQSIPHTANRVSCLIYVRSHHLSVQNTAAGLGHSELNLKSSSGQLAPHDMAPCYCG